MSYMQSDGVHSEASHAQLLELDPDWALVVGLGYDNVQKKGLIYKHLKKLRDSLWVITHGDPTKAKALSEMLYLRTHAGAQVDSILWQRNISTTVLYYL